MPLYLGIPLTILILVVSSQVTVGRFTMTWLAALLAGVWSASQSKKYMLQRFERVFPLEPLALGISVTLLFPVAFPWFLRLRHKALRGRLPLRTRPSRLRIALIVVAIGGGLLMQLGWSLLRRTQPWRRIETSMSELQEYAGGPFSYALSGRTLQFTIVNPALRNAVPVVQRDTALAIARKGLALAQGLSTVGLVTMDSVQVTFRASNTGGDSPTYAFPAADLR